MNAIFKDLLGEILTKVEINEDRDEILFTTRDGAVFRMYHRQDCCESVYIESVVGDLQDLVGSPITMAEEACNKEYDTVEHDSVTWTFYKLATTKGYVDIRWIGTSSGYYSESVDFKRIV